MEPHDKIISQNSQINYQGLLEKFAVPLAIVIAGAIIGVSLILALKPMSGTAGPVDPGKKAVNVKDVKITADTPYIGQKSAPVTLALWTDYQCPFCKAIETGGIPQINIEPSLPMLVSEYVDTGKLRIVFKDYAFLGPDSTTAALYGRAVWATYPDKYFEWRTAMYEAQDEEHAGFGDEASILALIKKIPGMNANTLKALVAKNKDKYTALITADREEGSAFGIQGTPGSITGTTLIDGARPPADFKAAIDAQLK